MDYCSHLIIAATADKMGDNDLTVFHSSSSHRNPVTWIQTMRYFWPYIGRNPFEKRITYPEFDMYSNENLLKAVFFLKRELPAKGFYYLSRLIGNPKMKKDAERYLKVIKQCKVISGHFSHFTSNEWIYGTINSHKLMNRLEDEDREMFMLDVANLDWKTYFPNYGYGMQKYLLKSEVEPPFEGRVNFINTKPNYFSDIMWVYYHGKKQKTRDHGDMKKLILNSDKVRAAMVKMAKDEVVLSALSEPKLIKFHENRGVEIMDRMAARLNYTKMRMLGWIMHKAFRNMYEKVVINRGGIESIRELMEKKDGNIIFCPTHRSYVDFLIITYVLYAHDIKVPHICAGEDFLNIAVIHAFLRNSGAFFMRRSFKDDPVYKSIFQEYVQQLLKDTHSLEFFLEGTRARSGKMLRPKFGLLNILTDAYFSGKVENLYF